MMWSEVGIERKRGVLLCVFGVQDMLSSENTTADLIGVVTVFLQSLCLLQCLHMTQSCCHDKLSSYTPLSELIVTFNTSDDAAIVF